MNARIDAPPLGLVPDMPAPTYHATRALSASGLKLLLRSPAHYFGETLDPNRPAKEATAALRNGSLTHCATLEPLEVAARYVVRPEGLDGRTKEGKAWLAEHAHSGLEISTAAEMASSLRQAAAVRAVPDVGALLSEGYAESSAFWIDDETGELCKCRPDWVHPVDSESVILLDLKTCQDASPAGFAKTVWNFRYDLQAAHYSIGFEQATGLRVAGFVFAAVESAWPHAAGAYMLDDAVMHAARIERRRLVDLYAECKATNRWPGYAPAIQAITLPRWALKDPQ